MKSNILDIAKQTISAEISAAQNFLQNIDTEFIEAVNLIINTKGRIIVMGVGKSGHIGSKIAATLASTGTIAYFVHPTEASHGDIGMISSEDVILAISNSGESDEILSIIPTLKRLKVKIISITKNEHSSIAKLSDVHLNTYVTNEACPFNLAPTSSTTVTLIIGDALAVTLLNLKEFTKEDFALSHPGGALGKKLILTVEHLMQTNDNLPKIYKNCKLTDAIIEISNKGLGLTVVCDDDGLIGIMTDGDLRRIFARNLDFQNITIEQHFSKNPKVCSKNILAVQALNLMKEHNVSSLIVVDDLNPKHVIGVITMLNIIKTGIQ